MNWQRKLPKQLFMLLLVVLLGWSITSCSKPPDGTVAVLPKAARSKLVEVSPPFVIQNLKSLLDKQPQVKILSPRTDQVLDQTEVEVKFQVSDLSLYKDEALELGPYLQVLLDNQPYTQVFDADQALTIKDLSPGTHTLRIFAVRPWHESFKNDGAFAQTSFHVFAKTGENQPDLAQPLLTYNAPQGTIGAEPVLLDFYLTNAPLHLVAQEDAEDEILDWRLRCTINGESFTFNRWEPIYLKGFKPGRNWVQLELLDDKSNPLPNVFNNVVQLITYEPGGDDTLSRITRGELTAEAARKIVDPNYVPPAPEPELELEPEPEVILEPDLTQEPVPETMPPEVIAPEEGYDSSPKQLEPELFQPKLSEPETSDTPQLNELEPSKPDTSDFSELKPVEPEPISEPDSTISPTRVPAETKLDSEPFEVIIVPEGNTAPVKVMPAEPMSLPTPESESPAESGGPESLIPDPEPNPLDALKASLEEVFQPDTAEQPATIPLPEQLETTEPAQPLKIDLNPAAPPSINSILDSFETTPVAPSTAEGMPPVEQTAPEFSLQPSKIPDMMSALDRVKGFFENLRKRPDPPALPLLLEDPQPDDSGAPIPEELLP